MSRIAVVLAVLLAMLVPVPGQAVFHFANIDEIMSGKGGDSTAQYVEIRMLSAAQGDVAHSRLTAFSCDGSTHTILLLDTTCTGGATTKFGASWTKATAAADCNTTVSQGDIETKIDNFAADVNAELTATGP